MARARSASFEIQRDAILAAAARLFAERGYPAASVADLAAALGVSKALMYHYYRDKEELLADIVDRYLDSLVALADEALREGPAGEALLRALIDRFMRAYEHSAAFHRVLVQDLKYLAAAHRRRAVGKQRQVVETFARAVAGAAPELEASALLKPVTMMLFGMMNWTFTWLRADGALAHADIARVIASMFLRGVQEIAHSRSARGPRAKGQAATGRRRAAAGRANPAQIRENRAGRI